jgi:post-segregation antitoxin (ccd killing protein)
MTQKQIEARKRVKQIHAMRSKIDEAKKEDRKRKARAYQIENREQYALLHRNYYRKKVGIPLDAPVMTPAECAANARKFQRQNKESK